jgi:hypothetical protein
LVQVSVQIILGLAGGANVGVGVLVCVAMENIQWFALLLILGQVVFVLTGITCEVEVRFCNYCRVVIAIWNFRKTGKHVIS